ncbi:hypothetical protein Goari_018331 [Gossypium aridum]|uniref:RNase H type-1 domain-containing protein n=1 Tax=Gossypium aridum TaxID=34290 RepID=A0A7J8WQD5_GOSAI|nr:hypothetical protein [Gossypium aridum]
MPTNSRIASIRPNTNRRCQRYGAENELFFMPSKIIYRLVLFFTVVGWAIGVGELYHPPWNSWKNRNNLLFRGKEEVMSVIWERALTLRNDFWVHNFNHRLIIPFSPAFINWKKPKKGFVKVNVNATVLNGRMGYRVIARDEEGFVMGGCGGCKDVALTSEWAALVAFEEGVQLARSLNLQNVIFESNNASLINRIKRSGMNISIIVQHVHETCRELKKFASVDVAWVRRSGNKIVEFICNFVLHNNCFWMFDMNYPKEIHAFVFFDAVNED